MRVWVVKRNNPSLGQTEHVGYFRSKKRAMDAALVTICNDHSDNQRWPDLQRFYDVDVTVTEIKNFFWLEAYRNGYIRKYVVASYNML